MNLPRLRELTKEQQKAVETDGNFAVYGGAGTGKTMVSIWRHIRNWEKGEKSYLLTFTHTLTYFLEILTSQENQEAKYFINNVHSFFKSLEKAPEIDELIVDEAQDLGLEIHKQFSNKFPKVSYGVDNRQHIYQNGATENELEQIYNPTLKQELFLNFRNSYQILELTKALFPDYGITKKMIEYSKQHHSNSSIVPTLIESDSDTKLEFELYKTLQYIPIQQNIAILVPTTKLMEKYRAILKNKNIDFSSYNYKDYGSIRHIGISRIHLTTFHSSKGLEFDNVIIPEFQLFSKSNRYYVGLTRAKTNLFLFSNGENILSNQYQSLRNRKEI